MGSYPGNTIGMGRPSRMKSKPVSPFLAKMIEARKAKLISQTTLATLIGVTVSTVSKWERGVWSPRLDQVLAWIDAVGLEVGLRTKREEA